MAASAAPPTTGSAGEEVFVGGDGTAGLSEAEPFDIGVVADGIGRLQPRLGRITAPAVVLHGAGDRVLGVASARHAAAILPNAGLQVVPGAGHMLPVTHAALCAAAIDGLRG